MKKETTSLYWQQAKHFEKQICSCISVLKPKLRATPFTILYIIPPNLTIKNLRHFSYSISLQTKTGGNVHFALLFTATESGVPLPIPPQATHQWQQPNPTPLTQPLELHWESSEQSSPNKSTQKEELRCILILEGKG